MNARTFLIDGKPHTRITKRTARKLWGGTHNLVFCPVNLRPGGPWAPHITFHAADQNSDRPFDRTVDNFEWYNCTGSETGLYTAFYVAL